MKLKITSILLLFLIGFSSCKKDIKLPTINVQGIQDTIYNNSIIWIFYKKEGNKTIADLNRNNKIENTHWIFNIDKRLTLQQILPHIQKMQEKKAAPSPHDNGEITHLYYSYVDTGSSKLSMVLFDSIQYLRSTEKHINMENSAYKTVDVAYTPAGLSINDTDISLEELDKHLQSILDTVPLRLHLHLDKNILYEQYIHLKAILAQVKKDSITMDTVEIIE